MLELLTTRSVLRRALATTALLSVLATSLVAQEERPVVYDEQADAVAEFEAAKVRAAKDNKHVLLVWGANWCGWCVKLDGLCKSDRQIARTLDYEYEVVKVDVGRFDKHQDLMRSLAADIQAIPFLTVVAPNGEVVVHQETGSLEEGSEHVPERVLSFLTEHQPEALNAREVFAAAKEKAEKEGKNVLVHLGAPWCGWCHRLEDYLGEPAIAERIVTDFVDLKIDTDRMVDGQELASELRQGQSGGIPWMIVVTPTGERLATSDGEEGTCGYPVDDHEVDTFMKMIEAGRQRLTDEDMSILRARLEERAAEILEARRKRREEAEKRGRESGGDR